MRAECVSGPMHGKAVDSDADGFLVRSGRRLAWYKHQDGRWVLEDDTADPATAQVWLSRGLELREA